MARAFAMRLAHLGLPVEVLGETTTPPVDQGDTLVAVSGSGTTHSTVHAAQTASDQGLWVVAVTSDPGSPLARVADRTLVIPAATKWRRPGEPATEQPLGSLFDQACHLVLDAVCLHLARRTGTDNRQARTRHASIE
jgi:6-phospho-3-hexuloisomerase